MGETKKIGVQIREEEEIEEIGGKEGYLERICTDIMGNVEVPNLIISIYIRTY